MMKQSIVSVIIFHVFFNCFGQERNLTGKVLTVDLSILPGVNISLKGTNSGTTTNSEGNFSISIPEDGATLVFSFIGMLTQEVFVTKETNIIVKLESGIYSDTRSIGIGVETDIETLGFASNLYNVSASSLSIGQSIIGQIPGGYIFNRNGTPGNEIITQLRGVKTLNKGNNPMILIDGVELGLTNLNFLDAGIFQGLETVFGAAGASVYGSQGANGVIQLTTRRLHKEELQIRYFSSVALNRNINTGKVRKANFHSYETDVTGNVIGRNGSPLQFTSNTSTYTDDIIWNSLDPTVVNTKLYNANLRYVDQYAQFFKSSYYYNNSIELSIKKNKVSLIATALNSHQNSAIDDHAFSNRTNISANLEVKLKNFNLKSITILIPSRNVNTDLEQIKLYYLNNSRPFADFSQRDLNGNYAAYMGDAVGKNHLNTNFINQYAQTIERTVDFFQSINLEYEQSKHLKFHAKYGINSQSSKSIFTILDQSQNSNVIFTNKSFVNIAQQSNLLGEIDKYRFDNSSQNFTATASFISSDKGIDQYIDGGYCFPSFYLTLPFLISTQVTFDWRSKESAQTILYRISQNTQFAYPTNDQLLLAKIQPLHLLANTSSYNNQLQTYGFLVNQRISFNSKFGVGGGFRTDHSSAFGGIMKKPATYLHFDTYLSLSELFKGQNFPFAKLRAAYGEAGNQPNPDDQYPGRDQIYYPSTIQKNPNLKPERSQELELGLDFSPFRDKIYLSATFWKRKTINGIIKQDLSPTNTFDSKLDNILTLGAKGIQAQLLAYIRNSDNFSWDITTNINIHDNRIVRIAGEEQIITKLQNNGPSYILSKGKNIQQLYGYLGLHSIDEKKPDGDPFIDINEQSKFVAASNGWVIDKATKQPYITSEEYLFGSQKAKINISLINNFNVKKRFSLMFQFDMIKGNFKYNQTKALMYQDGISRDYDKKFFVEGQSAPWTAFYQGVVKPAASNTTKNYFYEDASFIKLRVIEFSYKFEIKSLKIKEAILSLSSFNTLTLSKYSGFDPESTSELGSQSIGLGLDNNTVPNIKSFQATISVKI